MDMPEPVTDAEVGSFDLWLVRPGHMPIAVGWDDGMWLKEQESDTSP